MISDRTARRVRVWYTAALGAAVVAVVAVGLSVPRFARLFGPSAEARAAMSAIEVDGNGSAHDLTIVKSPDQSTEAVVLVVPPPWPSGEPATCRLVVRGREVTAEAKPGLPAVCVWVG